MAMILPVPYSSPSTLWNTRNPKTPQFFFSSVRASSESNKLRCRAVREKAEETEEKNTSPSPEEVTKKYGLEVGLWKVFLSSISAFAFLLGSYVTILNERHILSSKYEETAGEKKKKKKKKSKTDEAKELLAKYGSAYLATSITLSLISFSLCYALVTSGVDVEALLLKFGISTNETG